MFGIGGWEFILIAVLAMLLFGPDKLPQFARTLGRFMRDIKRYQDLMESTVRGEIFASDPELQKKDQFQTGKEFRERVAGGAFTKPEPKAVDDADPGDGAQAPGIEAEDQPEAPAPYIEEGEPISAITGEIAEGDDVLVTSEGTATEGEGERGTA